MHKLPLSRSWVPWDHGRNKQTLSANARRYTRLDDNQSFVVLSRKWSNDGCRKRRQSKRDDRQKKGAVVKAGRSDLLQWLENQRHRQEHDVDWPAVVLLLLSMLIESML